MVMLENNRDQGLEVMRVGGKVFARNRYGTFRQRLRDRGMAERTRAELTGAMRDMDALFQGRIQLEPQGTVTYEGRTAWRYQVKLGPEGGAAPRPRACPPCWSPRTAGTRRRAAAWPSSSTASPRAWRARCWWTPPPPSSSRPGWTAASSVPADKTPEAAELRMSLESALTGIGQDPRLQPPEKFLPDADKPEGIADALDRFGIPRARRQDAGPPGGARRGRGRAPGGRGPPGTSG